MPNIKGPMLESRDDRCLFLDLEYIEVLRIIGEQVRILKAHKEWFYGSSGE